MAAIFEQFGKSIAGVADVLSGNKDKNKKSVNSSSDVKSLSIDKDSDLGMFESLKDSPKVTGLEFAPAFVEEEKAKLEHNKILIICNPHNPVGRVWTKKELKQFIKVYLLIQLISC